jgi:hypothetical protein
MGDYGYRNNLKKRQKYRPSCSGRCFQGLWRVLGGGFLGFSVFF